MPGHNHYPWCTCGWCIGGGGGGGQGYSSFPTFQTDEARTYRTTCWWCGAEVYYHTNGYGDSVLFDSLGSPWEVHGCWEEYRDQTKSVKLFGLKVEQVRYLVLAGAIRRLQTEGRIPTEEGVAIEMGISVENLRQHYKSLYVIISEAYDQIVLAQGSTGDLGDGIEPKMIAIPGGRFQMGDNKLNDAKPLHSVTVKSFFMGKYPVTQEQYQAIMGTNPSYFRGAKLPVENVSWHDAVEFCRRLSQKTDKNYRLPSEAEWEYACRAGTQTKYYFGDFKRHLENYTWLGNYAWYGENSESKTHPVGQKRPNRFGLYDMHGNVWEWCSDHWHSSYDNAPTDGSSWETGADDNRVRRGGSWYDNAVYCCSAARFWNSAGHCNKLYGFRVALSFPLASLSLAL